MNDGSKQRDARFNGTTYRKVRGRHEHRVLVEERIGRKLRSDEVVHHVNGNVRDNSHENLVVVTRAEHARIHFHRDGKMQ